MNFNREMLLQPGSKIKIYEGAAHNLPDENALFAAKEILNLSKVLTEKDLLLVLVSGT